jgi:hypothetical protein
MTDENKFFRYLWRFNAVVLACAGIVVAGGMLYSILNQWRPAEPTPPAGHFAPVPQSAEKEFTYRLQSSAERHVVGQEELIPLGRWNGSPETYSLGHISSGGYVEETRSPNVLAVNQVTVESHWIFKGYNRNIIANDLIYEAVPNPVPPITGQPASAIALVMTVVDADTNNDDELTEKDRKSLYVYRAGAMEAARLLTADLIVSRQQSGNDRYLVVYENGNSAVAATFSIPEFKLIAEKPLPKVPVATVKN